MCFGDWRAGRLIRCKFSQVDTSVVATTVFTANMQRVGITFWPSVANASLTAGILIIIDGIAQCVLFTNGPPIHLTLATHGDLPTHAFTLQRQAVNALCAVIEYIAPETMIQAAIDEFSREYKF